MQTATLPPPPPLDELHAASAVSLFLDFDGTLVEIAPAPDLIDVPADIGERLKALATRHNNAVALVTGRGLDNIRDHAGALGIACAGSHGAERVDAGGAPMGDCPQPLGSETVSALRDLTANHDALFEQKRFGAAIHYRAAPETGPAIKAAVTRIAEDNGLAIKSGKCVTELVRPGADKGAAVDAFMAAPPFHATTPVFIGDDATDEDGFAAAQHYGGFGIAVGERASDHARYRLETVKDVHAWLTL